MVSGQEPPLPGIGEKDISTTPKTSPIVEKLGAVRTTLDAPLVENAGAASGSFAEIEVQRAAETQESQNTTEKTKMGHDFELLNRARDSASNPSSSSAGSTPIYKTYKRRWFGVVQIMLMNIIVSWDWLTFAPVSAKAATYYGVSESAINWFSTAFMFAFIPIFPVTIKILHLGPKLSVKTAAALLLVGNWIRYAGSFRDVNDGGIYGLVMFGQILTGLAQPFVLAAPTRYSDMWFTTRGRVGATAMMSLANALGAALGQLLVPELAGDEPKDVSKAVLYVSIIATVASIPSFFIPREPPTPVAPSSEHAKPRVRDSITVVTSSLEVWLLLVPFWIFVGLFNSISTVLVQIMQPYGYTEDQAGIGGGVLILVGLLAAAVVSPILDRTKLFLTTIKVLVPISAIAYLVFIWMPRANPGNVAGPYVVLAIIGACAFSMVPCALELLTELSYPVSPEITSTVAWVGGQLLGGSFILICDALKAGPAADPPDNLDRALVFQAILALITVPMVLPLGLFGREDKVALRRFKSDTNLPRPGGA